MIMAQTCQAAVFLGNDTYEVREFAVPDPPPGGAVIKVEAVGLCGSDVAQFHGVELVPGASMFPVIPGHETVGRVVKLAGDAALGVSEGDRVAVDEILSIAPTFRVYGYTDMTGDGTLGLWGGYGEYMEILPNTQLLPLTESVPAAQLSLFEPLANVINWFDRVDLLPGESVVIQGPGHMGLICAAYAKLLGAGTIIVTGRTQDRFRLDAALNLGATHVIDVDRQDLVSTVADLTDGRLVDLAVDLTDAAVTVGTCLELARMGGRVLWAGLKNMSQVAMLSDLVPLKGLTVLGGAGSTAASMRKAAEVLNAGSYPTEALQGEVFTLDEIDQAMNLLMRATPGVDAVRVGLAHH